jgi:tetratricopeptide (TPR) repeat protein
LIADAPQAPKPGRGERAGSGDDAGPARREHLASGRLHQALARFHVGDRRGARRELEAALRADPHRADAARVLARVLIGDGEPVAALAWMDHAARLAAPDHDAALERAVALEAAGRHAEAARALDRALAAAFQAPLGRFTRRSVRRPEDGLRVPAEGTSLRHADARFRIALRLVDARPAEAALHLEAAVAIHPGYLRARLALGLVELRRRRFPEARAELEAARALEPSYLDVRDWLGLARLLSGDGRGAVAILEDVVERCAGFARAQRHLALARHALGTSAAAFAAARAGVTADLDGACAPCGGWRGFAAEQASAEDLMRALLIRPEAPDLHLALGRNHRAAGDPTGARQALRTALALKARYADAAFELAAVELALARPRDAERLLSDVVSWRPEWIDAQASLGRLRLALGDPAGAVRPLRAALRTRPDLEPARSDLTRAIQELRGSTV